MTAAITDHGLVGAYIAASDMLDGVSSLWLVVACGVAAIMLKGKWE